MKFRFQYCVERNLHVVGWMPRASWETLKISSTEAVVIDPEPTPVASVSKEAAFLAMAAYRTSSGLARLEVYRWDPQDPQPINKDTYFVIEDFLNRPDYHSLVTQSSTSDSLPLRSFLNDHVAFVSEEPSTGHWLDVSYAPKYVIDKLETTS